MTHGKITTDDYLKSKYDDGHEHVWFSALGAPERCYLCGIGKEIYEELLMEDGLKWRSQNDT